MLGYRLIHVQQQIGRGRKCERSRFGEEDEGDSLGYPLPVWGQRDGKFTSHYSRTFVEAGQRRSEAPRVSAAQWEALDMLSDLALTSWRYLHQPEKILPRAIRKLAIARGFMVYEGLR